MAMIIRPLIIAVTDPGEGPRGEGATPTPYFQTILMPDGPKKIFGKRPSPLSQGLDDHFPSPPPQPLISSSGSGTVWTTPENTKTYHNTLY